MKFQNITLENLELTSEDKGSYIIPATDELIEITNQIRDELGYTDLVNKEHDNEVYYSFYLVFDAPKQSIVLEVVVAGAQKDDFASYNLNLSPEEQNMLMWKLVKKLATEVSAYIDINNTNTL